MPEPQDEWTSVYADLGYVWCRPHEEYHRPPECAIRADGSTAPWWEPSDAARVD